MMGNRSHHCAGESPARLPVARVIKPSSAQVIKPPGRERRAAPTGPGDLGHQLLLRTFALRGCRQPGKPLVDFSGDPQCRGGQRPLGTEGQMDTGTDGHWDRRTQMGLWAALPWQRGCGAAVTTGLRAAQARPSPRGGLRRSPVRPRGAEPPGSPRFPPRPRARPPPPRDSRRSRPARRGQPSARPERLAPGLERLPRAREVGRLAQSQRSVAGEAGGETDRQRLRPIKKRHPRSARRSVPGASLPGGAGLRGRKRPVPSASLPVPPPPPCAGCSGR